MLFESVEIQIQGHCNNVVIMNFVLLFVSDSM